MDRREALRTTSFVVGYSLSASAIAAALQGCRTEPSNAVTSVASDWKPAFLNQEQAELVAELADTLIPETATPGAKSVNVHQYIDDELQNFYRPQEQYRFVQGLDNVQARAQAAYGKTFLQCAMNERVEILKRLETEIKDEDERIKKEKERIKIQEGGVKNEDKSLVDYYPVPFFKMLKELTFRGYFTSEKIGKEVLAFDPVPGSYKGCIPLAEVGKLWSI